VAFHSANGDAQFDVGGRVVPRRNEKAKPRSVSHAGGNAHLYVVPPYFRTTATASFAQIEPRFAATATAAACALDGNIEWHGRTIKCLPRRQAELCPERHTGRLIDKRPAHPFDGGRHRRKINADLVGKAVDMHR
jgi:hypothetical protein